MSDILKISNENTKIHTYHVPKSATYKAPATGLEHVVFKYGDRMKPGTFKMMMELMAKHMAGALKKGGPEALKAMKNQERPK